ncbi:MAG: NUDIX hydrolase [Rhodanobacteraceae bacterium]|nr:MAG: NUDIX hydrolase [Rhodanobacteraceae bacterium]
MRDIASPPKPAAIWCPHVTVACVVADAGRFLLVEEAIQGELRLNQPAGHLEPNETLQQAALRETLEESGWDVALEHFIGVTEWHSPVHDHHMVRFGFAARPLRQHAERRLDTGIVRALWLTYPEILAARARLRSTLVLTAIEDWLAGQRLPLATLRSLLPAAGA